MSDQNSMTPQEAEVLFQEAQERQQQSGHGLSANSITVLKTATLTVGGVMMRAAGGRLGAAIKARRVFNLMIVLDGSGSMQDVRGEVVSGLNDLVVDLSSERNPERDAIEITIWIFSGTTAKLFTVSGQEIANVPVTAMPTVSLNDYQVDSTTPMNKTLLAAMGAGSLRAERLRMGIDGKQRRASMNYIILLTDGQNNIWDENLGAGQVVSYADSEVAQISRDLLTTEQWILAVGYGGPSSSQDEADQYAADIATRIGFSQSRGVGGSGWRAFLGMVSRSVKTASIAANASQAIGQGNTFLS